MQGVRSVKESRVTRLNSVSPGLSFSVCSGCLGREREFDGEARALAGLAVGADGAAVLLDDLLGDGEAQASPLLLGGEERLEDARAGLLVHPRPAGFYLDARARDL